MSTILEAIFIHCRQLLLVEAEGYETSKAQLRVMEWSERLNAWLGVRKLPAAIGRTGLSLDKREGDGKTPIGLFRMGTAFGTLPAPIGCVWPYRPAGPHDYWVDDPASPDYNQWVHCEDDPYKRWRSFERLDIAPYAYAAVIRYNDNPVVAGKGSAIFFHVWNGPDSSSAGCVTVAQDELERILLWLDPLSHPQMAIGTARELKALVPFYSAWP